MIYLPLSYCITVGNGKQTADLVFVQISHTDIDSMMAKLTCNRKDKK